MIEYEEVNVGGWTLIVGGQKEMTTGNITGLRPLTHYDIRVAAVNSAGIGPFTISSNASTSGITQYTHTSIQWVRIIIVVVSILLHSITIVQVIIVVKVAVTLTVRVLLSLPEWCAV